MKTEVILTPAEIDHLPERDLADSVCVVFDVLRATSSIVTALEHGAAAVKPVPTVEDAWAERRSDPSVVLGGERGGDRIAGFDVGNSPAEYVGLAGKRIVSTTTNGTVALRACAGARVVLAGALLNLDALVEAVRAEDPAHLVIVCAGTFREMALEDALAAGLLLERFAADGFDDAALLVRQLARAKSADVGGALREARNGRALLAARREADLEWCARVSVFRAVGEMRDGWVVVR